MANKDVTLYDVLKAVESLHSEVKGVSNRLDKFQQEMYEFKEEMYEFKNRTNEQLDTLNQKVSESINGMEAMQQRVWTLEKKQTVGTAE